MLTREEFARALLKRMGAPYFYTNKRALITWMQAEGSQARFNPMATTRRMPGSTKYNDVGVQHYSSLEQGIEATLLTLREKNQGYEKIRHRLQVAAPARFTIEAVGQSAWGTELKLLLEVLKDVKKHYPQYAMMEVQT